MVYNMTYHPSDTTYPACKYRGLQNLSYMDFDNFSAKYTIVAGVHDGNSTLFVKA